MQQAQTAPSPGTSNGDQSSGELREAQMTAAEAAMHLAHAKQMVDEMVEHTLDHAHDAMVRKGAPEDMIDEAMRSLRREVHEARTRALIRMAEIAGKRVEDGNVELH